MAPPHTVFGSKRSAICTLPATVTCLQHVASYAMQTSEPIRVFEFEIKIYKSQTKLYAGHVAWFPLVNHGMTERQSGRRRAPTTLSIIQYHSCLVLMLMLLCLLPIAWANHLGPALPPSPSVLKFCCQNLDRYHSCTQRTVKERLWIDSNGKNGNWTPRKSKIALFI